MAGLLRLQDQHTRKNTNSMPHHFAAPTTVLTLLNHVPSFLSNPNSLAMALTQALSNKADIKQYYSKHQTK